MDTDPAQVSVSIPSTHVLVARDDLSELQRVVDVVVREVAQLSPEQVPTTLLLAMSTLARTTSALTSTSTSVPLTTQGRTSITTTTTPPPHQQQSQQAQQQAQQPPSSPALSRAIQIPSSCAATTTTTTPDEPGSLVVVAPIDNEPSSLVSDARVAIPAVGVAVADAVSAIMMHPTPTTASSAIALHHHDAAAASSRSPEPEVASPRTAAAASSQWVPRASSSIANTQINLKRRSTYEGFRLATPPVAAAASSTSTSTTTTTPPPEGSSPSTTTPSSLASSTSSETDLSSGSSSSSSTSAASSQPTRPLSDTVLDSSSVSNDMAIDKSSKLRSLSCMESLTSDTKVALPGYIAQSPQRSISSDADSGSAQLSHSPTSATAMASAVASQGSPLRSRWSPDSPSPIGSASCDAVSTSPSHGGVWAKARGRVPPRGPFLANRSPSISLESREAATLTAELTESDSESNPLSTSQSSEESIDSNEIDSASSSSKSGYVWKRKKKLAGISNWKLRWLEVSDRMLSYYATPSDMKPIGTIDVSSAGFGVRRMNTNENSTEYRYCFELTTSTSKYVMATDSQEDLEEWIKILGQAPPGSGSSTASRKRKPWGFRRQGSAIRTSVPGSAVMMSSPVATDPKDAAAAAEKEKEALERHRRAVLREIVVTERSYCQDLSILIDFYMAPLETMDLLGERDREDIFGPIEKLLSVHQPFAIKLERDAIKNENVGRIALDLLIPKLDQYIDCCGSSKVKDALSRLHSLHPTLNETLEELRRVPECRQLDLHAFLIKPMQRLCKYPLLLRELISCTAESHPDHANLVAAARDIGVAIERVNEHKRKLDYEEELKELYSRVTELAEFEFISPGRRILRMQEFKRVSISNTSQRFTIVVFTDALVLLRAAKTKDNKANKDAKNKEKPMFAFHSAVPFSSQVSIDSGSDNSSTFSVNVIFSPPIKITIDATSVQAKKAWASFLTACLAQHVALTETPAAQQAPTQRTPTPPITAI